MSEILGGTVFGGRNQERATSGHADSTRYGEFFGEESGARGLGSNVEEVERQWKQ
jgi:hypothetical protein